MKPDTDHNAQSRPAEEEDVLPPQHYPEWDGAMQSYRPDWTTVYEAIQQPGTPGQIDRILDKHRMLLRQLKAIVDLLKPQNYVRIRYQEEGSELDLDVAMRSLIDFRSGSTPDPRINMDHRNDGRDIAVMLLIDLSESLNEMNPFISYRPRCRAARDLTELINTKFLQDGILQPARALREITGESKKSWKGEEIKIVCSVKCLYWEDCEFKNPGYPCDLEGL